VSGLDGPRADSAVAAIVTLQPESEVVRYTEAVIVQTLRIVAIDNAARLGVAAILESPSALRSVEVIRNPVNEGTARALDERVQAAMDAGADWLVTTHQDATLGTEIPRIAGHATQAYARWSRVSAICATSRSDQTRSSDTESRGGPGSRPGPSSPCGVPSRRPRPGPSAGFAEPGLPAASTAHSSWQRHIQ
jgi:GT2 family glycosyltransferase